MHAGLSPRSAVSPVCASLGRHDCKCIRPLSTNLGQEKARYTGAFSGVACLTATRSGFRSYVAMRFGEKHPSTAAEGRGPPRPQPHLLSFHHHHRQAGGLATGKNMSPICFSCIRCFALLRNLFLVFPPYPGVPLQGAGSKPFAGPEGSRQGDGRAKIPTSRCQAPLMQPRSRSAAV